MLHTGLPHSVKKARFYTLGADKQYYYEKVFDVPSKLKDELFKALKMWVVRNVKTQSNTNFFDEEGHNTISTTPAFTVAYNSVVSFKMNIDIKDGKYRILASSFIWTNFQGISKVLGDYSRITMPKKSKAKVIADVDDSFTNIISSIQSAVGSGNGW